MKKIRKDKDAIYVSIDYKATSLKFNTVCKRLFTGEWYYEDKYFSDGWRFCEDGFRNYQLRSSTLEKDFKILREDKLKRILYDS